MLGLLSSASVFGPRQHVLSYSASIAWNAISWCLSKVICSLLNGRIAKVFLSFLTALALLLQDHEEDQPFLESHVPSTYAV